MEVKKLRIKLKSFDHRVLDKAVKEIVETARRTGANISGPIPLPTKIMRFTVLRSPHVDKKSMEAFEQRVHKRLIEIIEPQPYTIEALGTLDIPAGVDVEIRVLESS